MQNSQGQQSPAKHWNWIICNLHCLLKKLLDPSSSSNFVKYHLSCFCFWNCSSKSSFQFHKLDRLAFSCGDTVIMICMSMSVMKLLRSSRNLKEGGYLVYLVGKACLYDQATALQHCQANRDIFGAHLSFRSNFVCLHDSTHILSIEGCRTKL